MEGGDCFLVQMTSCRNQNKNIQNPDFEGVLLHAYLEQLLCRGSQNPRVEKSILFKGSETKAEAP